MHAQRHPDTVVIAEKNGERFASPVVFNNFADGDTHCVIKDTSHITGARVLIKHYLYPNQNEQIVRLLFLLGIIADFGPKSVEVFTPYLPYARQDKAHTAGEIISSQVLCRLLHTTGVDILHTIDCHFMKGVPKMSVQGLTVRNHLVQKFLIKELESLASGPYRIIGPDAGSKYLTDGDTMKKARSDEYSQLSDGSIHRAVATLEDDHLHLSEDVVVVADDMVSTGSTMIKALETLNNRGVPELYAMTSHGLFLQESFEKISALTKHIICADTIPRMGATPIVDTVFEEILG